MALEHQLMADRGQQMRLPHARFPGRDDVDGIRHERSAPQPLDLELHREGEGREVERIERLLQWKPRLAAEPDDPMLLAPVAFGQDQLVEECLVSEVGLGRLQGQIGEGIGHRGELEDVEHGGEVRMSVHGRVPRRSLLSHDECLR
jgi:hypothetical protein